MKLKKKIIAILLLTILLSSNIMPLGSMAIAISEVMQVQDSKTNLSNVEFNSYFEGEVHEKTFDAKENGKLYIYLKIKENGYLRNGIVQFKYANYKIDTNQIESKYIQKIENETIYLEQINAGEEVLIEIPIAFQKDSQIDSNYLSRESETIFKGNYVNGNGNERIVQKTIINKVEWKSEDEIEIDAEITKFLPYQSQGEYGLLIQSKIAIGAKENILPIENTNIEIVVPTINELKPERVSVVANSTKATNGIDNGISFNKENYSYDNETGKVNIQINNYVDAQGKITYGDGKDEYLVTYIYTGKEIYDYIEKELKEVKVENVKQEQIKSGDILINANIKLYSAQETILQIEEKLPYKIEETIGEISDFDIISPKAISKAYLYANYDKTENKEETTYELTYQAQIYDAKINNKIEFEINKEKIEFQNNLYSAENNIYVKQIEIPENIFTKILGENGKVDILKKDGTIIGSISKQDLEEENTGLIEKQTKNLKLENGVYILNIEEAKTSEIVVKTSDVITEGMLEVKVEKAFLIDHEYTKKQIKEITKIETSTLNKMSTDIKEIKSEIVLQELTNKAEISVKEGKEILSTVVVNEDVQIRAVLDTSNITNALYKNPTIKIKLPSYISKIKIKSADILMDNGLKIKSVKGISENGTPVIMVELEGTQTDYTIGAEYKGTIIVLNTDITVKTLTPTNENKIEMIYTNENDIVEEKEGTENASIKFVAPSGVVAANAISNYAKNSESIMSISSKTEEAKIETYTNRKIATVTGTVVNNYGNKITDFKILGRLPSKENKKIDTQEDLGTTFNAIINSEIKVVGLENYKVYYSNKVDADADLENDANGWTEKFSKSAKSYLIVPEENYEMDEQETIEFSYDIEIPENLTYNNSSYEMYKVYYTNMSEVGNIGETKESAIIALTTGEGPELDVKLDMAADTVREGQIVKMILTVTNTGNMEITNAKVNIPKPDYANFITYKVKMGFQEDEDIKESEEIKLGTMEPGQTVTLTYYIKIDSEISRKPWKGEDDGKWYYLNSKGEIVEVELEEDEETEEPPEIPEPTLINKLTVISDEAPEGIPSNEIKQTIEVGEMELQLFTTTLEEYSLVPGNEAEIFIRVRKINKSDDEEPLHNVEVTLPLYSFDFKSATISNTILSNSGTTEGITYDKNSKELKVKIDSLTNEEKIIRIKVVANNNTSEGLIMATAKAENVADEQYSNAFKLATEKINLQVSTLTSTPKYVKEGENITYKFSITNAGNAVINNVCIKDILPKELFLEEAYYEYNGNKNVTRISENNTVTLGLGIMYPNITREFTIIAKAKALEDQENKEDKKVDNKVTITVNYLDDIQTNTVTNIIQYNEDLHKDEIDPDNPNVTTQNRYKISGTAWLDENKDGKRDETEKLLSNIPVVLVNKANNTVVVDLDTNQQKRATTNKNGEYEFTNIPKGEYLVLFLYDSSSYSLTTYQAEGVEEDINSDAIDMKVVFEGETKIAGITNVVAVTASNVRGIDIGLYVSEKFDLRLDKYISKITLTTPTIGTRVTNYNDTQLAKVEILGKNVNKSSIIVEYKIKVTNEGKVAGYAKKLIDYLPEGASFSSEINREWYLSDNNKNVYNTSLENTKINPGESKEVTLILSFNITDKNIGNIVNNNAEIYESYNEEGKLDIDSVAGNNASEEDDISKADIVLSVVTGKLVVGVVLIILVLVILVVGVIEIKKRVLKREEK